MRIALISDIHGNLTSLEAVLADIARQEVNQIIFLGDAVTLGPQPREVFSRLRELGCPCILGNHETFLLAPALLKDYTNQPWVLEVITWCRQQLTPDDLAFLHTFHPYLEVSLDPERPKASKMLCFHGSPHSNQDVILATTEKKKLKKMFAGHKAAIMAGGHTHVQMMRQHNGTVLLNPGSVGMPFQATPFKGAPRILPWAEYAMVNWSNRVLSIDLRRVPVSLEAILVAATTSDMPDRQNWVNNWQLPQDLW